MPFTPHYLLQYGGLLGTKGEVWSNTIRFHSVADLDPGIDPTNELAAKAVQIKSLFMAPSSRISDAVTCTYVKLNAINADGHYASNTESNTLFLEGAARFKGATTTNYHPFQCSLVVTWVTDKQRGRASKGRIYAPGPAIGVDNEGQISLGEAQGIADRYKTFLTGLNTWEGPLSGLRANVMSGINGAANPIKKVSVGSVIDTMRTRRNALVETRATATL